MTPPERAAASSPPRLDQRVDIETPEQVVFSYTVAGIGTRAAAAILDYLIMGGLLLALGMLLVLLARVAGGTGRPTEQASGAWAVAVILLLVFAVQWGYYVFFEALWDGQTPGKRKLGIRVVQDGGYSMSFAASAARNITRIVDMQPAFCYGVGVLSAAFSKSGKRLGDMIAGTLVVQERVVQSAAPSARAITDDQGGAALTAALAMDEYELLERFLARRASLDPERRRTIAEQLVERFRDHLPEHGGQPLALLVALHEREASARARGAASRGAMGAGREQHAIVATGAPRWSAFASALAEAQRRGLRTMTEREVSELIAQYREVATDLARLKTASRGRDVDALFHVNRLVSAGHNLLYRRRTLPLRDIGRFVLVSVPRELRRSALPILGAAVLLFFPMAVTFHAVTANPPLAEQLLPPGMIDRANEGVERARRGDRTYVQVKSFERPVMASQIIANNVQVTYAVFALGITAGIFTVILLVFNGVSIGAGFALYASKGILDQIGGFVLPHSVFELSAICIAGGGGLLLASAILLPGHLTRREALVVRGRRAIRLLTASTILLVFAGLIEGLISPRTDIPLAVKYAVAGICAVALAAYIALGNWGGEEAPEEEFAYTAARALSSR